MCYTGAASCSGRLFSFGIISDIQYADIENGFSFKKIPRYYRCACFSYILPHMMRNGAWKGNLFISVSVIMTTISNDLLHRAALPALQRAVQAWRDQDVNFGMHFGIYFNLPSHRVKTWSTVVSVGWRIIRFEQDRMPAGDIIDGYHPKDQSMAALDAITAAFDELGKPHWHMIGNHCLYNLPREVHCPENGLYLSVQNISFYDSHACFPLYAIAYSALRCCFCGFCMSLCMEELKGVLYDCGTCRC